MITAMGGLAMSTSASSQMGRHANSRSVYDRTGHHVDHVTEVCGGRQISALSPGVSFQDANGGTVHISGQEANAKTPCLCNALKLLDEEVAFFLEDECHCHGCDDMLSDG